MEGDPVLRRDDPLEPDDADLDDVETPRRHPDIVPVTILSAAFGIAAALAAVIRSDVLSAPGGTAWLLSAVAIAVIAGCWLAGFIHLLRFLMPGAAKRRPSLSQWPARLAAFAAGPLLVALFFFGTGLGGYPVSGVVVFPAAAILVVILLFARHRVRLMAERLLVSFFLWLFILVAPTFWRDPVNDQMSSFLFGLLKAAGLLT